MTTALFSYRRKVTINGVDVFNDNFINPLNVTSFFWEINEEGNKILNVYLNAVRATNNGSNAFSIRFGDSVGAKFVQHMEDFLRYFLAAPLAHNNNNRTNNRSDGRTLRRPVEAEVIEEDHTGPAEATFVS